MLLRRGLTLLLFMTLGLQGCTKSDDDGGDSSGEKAGDGGDNSGDNGDEGGGADDDGELSPSASAGTLALGYPQDLVVSSPLTSDSPADIASANGDFNTLATGALAVDGSSSLALQQPPPGDQQIGPKGFAEARLQLARILYGAQELSDCAYTETPSANSMNLACYGPAMNYQNHPDGSGGDGMLPSGDLGIWLAEQDGEACVARKMNSLVESVSSSVNSATGIGAMLVCAYKLGGGSEPEAGDTIDLNPDFEKLQAAYTGSLPAVTDATLVVAESAGQKKYTYSFSFAADSQMVPAGGQAQKVTHRYDVKLVHAPGSTDASKYEGKLQLTRKTASETNVNEFKVQRAMSVHYRKSGADSMFYELREGGWEPTKAKTEIYDEFGNARLPRQGDANNGGEFSILQINPENGTGSIAYAWLAGQGGENARSFVASTEIAGDKKVGCGYFGFGDPMDDLMDARDAAAAGDQISFINRFICNWAGPGNEHTGLQVAQKQCMELIAGKWSATENYLSYSPQNDCQMAGGDDYVLQKANPEPLPGWENFKAPTTEYELLPIVDSYTGGQDNTTAILSSELMSPELPADFSLE